MTSKQRAYLKSMAMKLPTILNIGKENVTEEFCGAVSEALDANELIKISILKNSSEEIKSAAEEIAEVTGAEVVQTIGHKMVLYKAAKKKEDRKIILPRS